MLFALTLIGTSLAGGPSPEETERAETERVPISVDKHHLTILASHDSEFLGDEYRMWGEDFDSVTVTNVSDAPITVEAAINGEGFYYPANNSTEHTVELIPGEWITLVVRYELPETDPNGAPAPMFESVGATIDLTVRDSANEELYANSIVLEANVMTMPNIGTPPEHSEAPTMHK